MYRFCEDFPGERPPSVMGGGDGQDRVEGTQDVPLGADRGSSSGFLSAGERDRELVDFSSATGLDVVRVLGRGGTGVVLLVRASDGAHYAVKALDKSLTSSPATVRQGHVELMREAAVMGALRHTGICTFLGCDVAGAAVPHLAMEWVDGLGLAEFWEDSNTTQRERFDAFSQVCEAVAYMHEQRYIHGDLRVENVMVCRGGSESQAKLIDFGSSFRVDMLPSHGLGSRKWGAAEFDRGGDGLHRCVRVAGIGDSAGLAGMLRRLLDIERNLHGNVAEAERLGRRFARAVSGPDFDIGHLSMMTAFTMARKSRLAVSEASDSTSGAGGLAG